jgi:hypothetical protein
MLIVVQDEVAVGNGDAKGLLHFVGKEEVVDVTIDEGFAFDSVEALEGIFIMWDASVEVLRGVGKNLHVDCYFG